MERGRTMSALLRRPIAIAVALMAAALATTTAQAEKKYDPGASDTEIRIGNIMPIAGPCPPMA